MFFAPQERRQDFARVLQGVIEVDDLDRGGKTQAAHLGQPGGPINEPHHLQGPGPSAPNGLLPQQGAKRLNGSEGGDLGGGFGVAHRVAPFIPLMLGKDAAQIRLPRFGAAVGVVARAALQFCLAHRHP